MTMTKTTTQQQTTTILVIGATGRTGLECIHALANHKSKPSIYAFCRDATKLADGDKKLCTSIVTGNAKSQQDIEKALRETKATVVVEAVGNGDYTGKSDTRTASAQALAGAMKNKEFQDVRAMVISSLGAGSSTIVFGYGIGMMISYHLRHVLEDHDGQELAFTSSSALWERTCIVRATNLVDGKPLGKTVYFGDKEKAPTSEIDRADLAGWVANQICGDIQPFAGKIVNITAAPAKN